MLPGGIIDKPRSTKENKTGGWRIFRPVVDSNRCIRCGICEKFCPEGCIDITQDNGAVVDYDYCKGCGICANECPVKAIEMEREEK